MASEELRDLLQRNPFEPFRVRVSSGDHYDIVEPFSAVLTKSRLFIAIPNSDRVVYVPYLHIAAVETLPRSNGRSRGRRGGNGR
jgi:hypothetical protein